MLRAFLLTCLTAGSFIGSVHATTTMDFSQGTEIDTTADAVPHTDLKIQGGGGSPPTFLININAAEKADIFGQAYANVDCADLAGLAFAPGNFLPDPGDIFFVKDGTRYAKVQFNSVNPGVSINLSYDSLGTCVVAPPPVSSFTFTTYDQIGFFTDTSTNTPASWLWDFGGTGSGTSQNPSFFFPAAASFNVSMTATNVGGPGNTAMQNVVLTQRPSTTFAVGSGVDLDGDGFDDVSLIAPNGCGGNATFAVSNGAKYAVHSQDYRTVSVANLPPSINGTGNFCATAGVNGLFEPFFVLASNGSIQKFWAPEVSAGSARIEFAALAAAPPPPPTTAWTFSTYDLIAFFTDTSTGAPGSWAWDFGDAGTSTAQSPAHFYPAASSYTASLTASNTGGPGATVPKTVTVATRPSTSIALGGSFDFDGDGIDDLAVIAPNGCGGNVTLQPLNGATWAGAGADYRTLSGANIPGSITATGDFCATEGVDGLFNSVFIKTSINSVAKFWTPEVDAGGLRMEFEVLVLVTVPGMPTGVSAARGSTTASITFTAPVDDGGSPILDYTASCGAGSSSTVVSDAAAIIVTGLANGTTYSCTVTARNAVGFSLPSLPALVTPATLPGAPTAVTAARGDMSASIGFSPPASNGGDGIVSYTASCGIHSTTGPASPLVVTGLTNGVIIGCHVYATNTVGDGPPSADVNVTPATTPGAPAITGIVQALDALTVYFDPPASDGGDPISGYSVDCGGPIVTGTASPIAVTGLQRATQYMCSVTAENSVGSGASSALVAVSTLGYPIPVLSAWGLAALLALVGLLGWSSLRRRNGFQG